MKRIGLWFLLAACAPTHVTGTIGPGGGTLVAGGLTVEIPAGALSDAVEISIRETPETPAPENALGQVFTLEPEGQTFAKPIALRFSIAASQLLDGERLRDVAVMTAPQGGTTFAALPTVAEAGAVLAEAAHFSLFVPALPTRPVSVECVARCGLHASTTTNGAGLGCGCEANCQDKKYAVTCNPQGECDCTRDGQKSGTAAVQCTDDRAAQDAFFGSCGFTAPLPCDFTCSSSGCNCGGECMGVDYHMTCENGTCRCLQGTTESKSFSASCGTPSEAAAHYTTACGFSGVMLAL